MERRFSSQARTFELYSITVLVKWYLQVTLPPPEDATRLFKLSESFNLCSEKLDVGIGAHGCMNMGV